ncbi:MAG: dTMP kinase [Candidatus Bipolaricaulota bacterium]|nr:dTMP kinase [Candidatus Bipolaricaulota bacterium]MCX7843825.1 dTMP kinase [Candidatus Bipolaricaulota bacterium]MDW8151407.1 dTMP kinase [Candidatus Bipolaricaulota bacterium]
MKPLFIVLEGPDAAGKSTQLRLLAQALAARGIPVVTTREPGGTPLGERIRTILLDPASRMRPLTELLLLVADRHEHVEEVIKPALAQGKWVLCSRYTLSSLAYQGRGRGLPLDLIQRLNELATGGLQPDYVFLLDLPPQVALARTPLRDRFEGEGLGFFTQVRLAYLEFIRTVPRGYVIDATLPPAQVTAEILARLPLSGYDFAAKEGK